MTTLSPTRRPPPHLPPLSTAATTTRTLRRPQSTQALTSQQTMPTRPPLHHQSSNLSDIDIFIRNGPQGDIAGSMDRIRKAIVLDGVEQDSDGMVKQLLTQLDCNLAHPSSVCPTYIRLEYPPWCPANINRQIPRNHSAGRLPRLFQDPKRHISYTRHRSAFQTSCVRGLSDPPSERPRLDPHRDHGTLSIARYGPSISHGIDDLRPRHERIGRSSPLRRQIGNRGLRNGIPTSESTSPRLHYPYSKRCTCRTCPGRQIALAHRSKTSRAPRRLESVSVDLRLSFRSDVMRLHAPTTRSVAALGLSLRLRGSPECIGYRGAVDSDARGLASREESWKVTEIVSGVERSEGRGDGPQLRGEAE